MRRVVRHRAGAHGGGGVVDGAGDDLRPRRQPERLRRLGRQRPEHLRALHDLGQLVGVDAAVPHQAGVVLDVVGVAVVGHPAREDRVEGRDEAPGEAQVQVVEHVEELVGALVDLGEGVAHEEHVRRRVLAGGRGHAAGEADPAADARQAHAVHVREPAELPPQVRRAAHVHPQDAVHEGAPLAVDRHRAFALGAAADGGDLGRRAGVAGEESPRRGDQRPPPVVRRLLGAAARQHAQGHGLALPGGHSPVDADERHLGARGAEVDGEDVLAGHPAQATANACSRSRIRSPASSMPTE